MENNSILTIQNISYALCKCRTSTQENPGDRGQPARTYGGCPGHGDLGRARRGAMWSICAGTVREAPRKKSTISAVTINTYTVLCHLEAFYCIRGKIEMEFNWLTQNLGKLDQCPTGRAGGKSGNIKVRGRYPDRPLGGNLLPSHSARKSPETLDRGIPVPLTLATPFPRHCARRARLLLTSPFSFSHSYGPRGKDE